MKALKYIATFATTLTLFSCAPTQPKITFQENFSYFSRPEIEATSYIIEDSKDKLKRDILLAEGLMGKSLDALVKGSPSLEVNARVEKNHYSTAITLEFSSSERTHSLRFYDDGNDGIMDEPVNGPKHASKIANRLLGNKQ